MEIVFYILLFFVAFLYASVGHGGASGYLALMALFSMAPDVMKPTALMLNLFVSLTAFVFYYKSDHFKWAIFWPFALASIPFAFIGGMITMDVTLYKKILGVIILIPIFNLLFLRNKDNIDLVKSNLILSLTIGALIGFLSGLMGIGGGIILSPLLLLLRWTDMKQTAAISALFIFVNSLSGLIGQISKGIHFNNDMILYVILAFFGGLLGSYYGAKKFNQLALKYVLAIVLLIASLKLLFT